MLRTMLRYPVKTSASATDNPVPGSGLLLPSDYIQNDWRSRLGINSNFSIYDQNDTTDLIKKLIAENSPTAACVPRGRPLCAGATVQCRH